MVAFLQVTGGRLEPRGGVAAQERVDARGVGAIDRQPGTAFIFSHHRRCSSRSAAGLLTAAAIVGGAFPQGWRERAEGPTAASAAEGSAPGAPALGPGRAPPHREGRAGTGSGCGTGGRSWSDSTRDGRPRVAGRYDYLWRGEGRRHKVKALIGLLPPPPPETARINHLPRQPAHAWVPRRGRPARSLIQPDNAGRQVPLCSEPCLARQGGSKSSSSARPRAELGAGAADGEGRSGWHAGDDGDRGGRRLGGRGAADEFGGSGGGVQDGADCRGVEDEADQPQPTPQAGQASRNAMGRVSPQCRTGTWGNT